MILATVDGNMLATKAMVAKSAFAIGGAGNQYEFTVNGDTLVLTQPGPSSSW